MKHINLTQMLQGCSKRNGMTVRASNPDGEPTVNRQSRLMSLSGKKAEKEQLSPSCLLSASFPLSFRSRYLRYAAMIFCVLAMSVANIGMAWGTSVVALDPGTYSLASATATGSSKQFGMCNNIYYGRNGSGVTVSSGLNAKGILVAFKISSASKVTFSLRNTNTSNTRTDAWDIKPLTEDEFAGIVAQYDARGTATTYYSCAASAVSSISGEIAKSSTGTTSESATLSAGCYGFYQATHSGDGNYITGVTITASAAPRTFKSGQIIYFKDYKSNMSTLGGTTHWKNGSGNVYAKFYDASAKTWTYCSSYADLVYGSWNGDNAIYKITVPGSGKEYTKVIFTRGTSNTDGNTWNKTVEQTPEIGKNMFIIADSKSSDDWTGSWSKYAPTQALIGDFNDWDPDKGKFVDGRVILDLEADTDYEFKVLVGDGTDANNYWSCSLCSKATNTIDPWQQLYSNQNNWSMRSAEAGEYCFHWNNDTHHLGIYYPQARLKAGEYIYFDSRDNSTWKAADFTARYYFKYYDSGSDQSNKDCTKANATDTWVYNTTVPNNDYIGSVQMNRMVSGSQKGVADLIYAKDRTSSKQNCIHIASGSTATNWTTYCPPMSSATLSDNSTVKISWQTGDGTSGNPYLVDASGTIKVSASATKAVPDDNMTPNYDFKVSDNGGAASSAQSGTGTTYDKGSLSNNHTYEISLDAWNSYNETNGTKNTSATHIWYKALTTYSVTHTLSGVTKSTGREGSGAAAYYQPYTATYAISTGYTMPATITVKFGSSTKTAGTDYTWNSSTGELNIPSGKIDGNVTIIIDGVAKTTAITLDKNNSDPGSTNGSVTATYGSSSLTSLVHATRTGYTQDGYETSGKVLIIKPDGTLNTSKDGYTSGSNWINESSSLTLYARWTANKFNVTHTLSHVTRSSGGEAGSNKATYGTEYSVVFAADGGYTLPAAVSVTVGESDVTANCTWNQSTGTLTIPAAYVTGNIVITVTGEAAVTYTVTYEYNGADGGLRPASATGSSVSLPNPTKEGYTLQGWYTSSGSLAGAATATYNPTSNITLYALWREDACAGGGGGSSTITIGDFETNKHDKSNGKPDDFAKYQYGYINPSAKTSANAVTITTSSGNSCYQNSGADFLIYYGNSIRIYANNTTTGGTPASFEDVTSVSLKIKNANSSSFSSFSIKVGETTVANAVALSAEYNSYKVYTVSGLSNLDGRITIINHGTGGTGKNFYIDDIAITTAGGGGECYYVTYNGNGADGGFTKDEASHPRGSNVTVKTNSFTKTGYTFTGWNTDPDGEDGTAYAEGETISSIAGNMTLYAQWIESGSTYDITYHCNGATSGCPDNATGQVALPDPLATPTKTNYSFGGWYTDEGLSDAAVAGATLDDDADLYAKWTQTITLKTGAQGSGADKTPTVVWQGTALNGFSSAHTATGYTLQGYYTAGSGGVKVLNADGTFAAANVTDYITSSKWSRTGAAPTLFAQWVATEDCRTLKYVWKVTGNFCDDKSTATSAVSMISENDYFTLSGTGYKQESGKSLNLQNTQNNYFLLTAKTGYQIKSICFYGKVQDSSVDYTTDGSSWSALASTKTDEDKYYTFDDIDASAFGIKLTAATPSGIWIRNMVIEVCAAGGTTYNVTYDGNDETGGTAPTDASSPYAYGATVTVLGNTGSLAKTNYTFAGWTTNNNGTGSSYEAGSTFSITDNTTLYAKWTQSVTLDKNGGSTDGSATAVWNATGLTGITHATPVSGYKLTGYYTAATEGTKVLNSDGSFASSNVTDYITDGKWSRTDEAPTLYAQYEVAGSLTWNLGVNTDATSLTTSSKTSAFTQIAVANMSNATTEGVTYSKSKKTNLTGLISTPATEQSGQYVYVTFVVADGYKFTPSSVKVKAQPKDEAKYVKFELSDASTHSQTYTSASLTAGSIHDVIMTGDGTAYTGTVTLKIFCYGGTNSYRLGTPIEIQGEVEARCATMPSFTQMNYTTTTFAPNADASGSPITIVGGENIDTYQWKYNTTNDRTSGTNCGTGPSLDPLTDVASGTTRYYWCEMTNDVCGITIKSPAVAITVVAAKSDATVSWTGTTASANYGGGGYTVTATVSTAGWDGTLTEDMLTAMDGVVLSNIAVTNDGKTISANFGVTEGANAEATNVAFYLNHPATTGYNAIDETYNTTTLETSCIGGGGGDGSSYDVRVRKNTTTILQGKSTVYGWDTPTKGFVTQSTGGSVTSTKSGYDDEPVFDSISKGNAKAYWVKSYVANVKKIRVYGQVGDDDLTATGVYHVGSFVAGGSSTAVAYSVIYEDEVDALKKGNHWFEITLDEAISTNDIIYFTVNKNFKIMGVRLTTVGAGGATLATALSAWSPAIDTRKEVYEDAASFIETVTKTGANANTMGAITYSSGDETIATVDNRTGRVTIANSITWGDAITYKDVTITASLAPSGCYQGKTATYTLRVNKLTCTEAAGTITASSEGSHVVIEGDEVKKCTGETVTLTLGGYEEGATSFQWYKDGVLQGDKTTSAITTGDAGVWYAVSNKGCAVTSTNEITITNRSTSVHATRLVKEWYIKHGRLTPDIALWELGDDCSFVSVAASDGWVEGTGLTGEGIFYEQGGVVYMKGTEPKTNDGAQQDYTLTLTVNDGCSNQTLDTDGKKITIHHQQNTDKHVLAFIVSGTDKGDWTAGVTADQTTNVGLYNAIAAKFDVLATNSRSTDDEQKLKEYYSQFDILCITDYPNTGDKGANKKSYVDALGALIDIRPILTMEAWVSKLANWKAKGLSGNPKNPTTRQYTMDLQCKDHEIFAGTDLTKVGEGDEAMYRVSMVDNTKEDYATLDATYGEGAHADKSGYEYASKPALQGFTFTEEMANDLLPIGLIDDGAGNPLQVGIERQRNMEARLMVLGINSYAMERLTVDGEQVVINALNYLMKKNAEDIADCSIYFTGGDADEDESTRNNWNVDSHWSNGTQPISTQKVRILAPCVIPSGVQVHVTDVLIVPDGPINHGADVADGSLKIEAGGALIVDGKVEETTAPNYFHPHGTSAENLVLNTSSSAQAALILDNEDGDTQATVELYSLGCKKDGHYQFQYYAVPMDYVSVSESFAGSDIYTYVWHEATGWERRGYYTDLYAFEGVGITTKLATPKTYTMKGALASTATKEITLTKDDDGYNLIGNSWTAPIQISQLEEDNGSLSNKTVYIYNAGNDTTAAGGYGTTAGQWTAIPFSAAGFELWSGLKVIPAMQAFELVPTSEETLTLDYEKVVRGDNQTLTEKLHAPRRVADHAGIELMRIRVADSQTRTDLHLFEGERFSDEFDNGWEAAYKDGDDGTTKLYADVALGRMAVVATDELEGTLLGFAPGKETEYTFTFGGEGMGYYLNDLKLKKSTPISEGETYSFTYEEGDTNRFYISRTPIDAPQTPTGVENTHGDAVKARKFIYNDKLYIMLNGRVYSAEGQIVK